ncbi:hypothetical protein V8C35DRAFT_284035, partial [Trichoderma chlorosporum]
MSDGQVLLKRNAIFNDKDKDFYDSWEKEHGQRALPWALATGVTYYAQIHRINSNDPNVSADEWDGAIEYDIDPNISTVANNPSREAASAAYYKEQIVEDERRIFISDAASHSKNVPHGTVNGTKVVMIENGKATRPIDERWTKLWQDNYITFFKMQLSSLLVLAPLAAALPHAPRATQDVEQPLEARGESDAITDCYGDLAKCKHSSTALTDCYNNLVSCVFSISKRSGIDFNHPGPAPEWNETGFWGWKRSGIDFNHPGPAPDLNGTGFWGWKRAGIDFNHPGPAP